MRQKRIDETKWKGRIGKIRESYGNVPIIAFIDWTFTADTPLEAFSQTLSKEEQREALMNFDEFFAENGIIFAYSVHGGYMGRDATKLAFDRYYKYDSLALEFDTYETIRKLAQNRRRGQETAAVKG